MKAISIRQPWVWAILNAGKDIENRDWKPTNPGLRFRGPVLIHASSGMGKAEYAEAKDAIEEIAPGIIVPPFEQLERGGIIARAIVKDIVTIHSSPWFFGRYGLVLTDIEKLPFVTMKGALGFFETAI